MKQFSQIAISVFALVFFSGCATVPPAYDYGKQEGEWEAKAQIRDLEKNKTNNVSLEVMAEKGKALRMEVTGSLGVSVASFLLKDNEVSYAIHTQKRFFSGPSSERALAPLLNVNVDPWWLYNVFFDLSLEFKDWICQRDSQDMVENCVRPKDGMKIVWSERQSEKKRVSISNEKFELQILVKGYKPKVQSPDKAFSLNPPDAYKRYKLQ